MTSSTHNYSIIPNVNCRELKEDPNHNLDSMQSPQKASISHESLQHRELLNEKQEQHIKEFNNNDQHEERGYIDMSSSP